MTSPQQLDPAQQRARFDTLASLEKMVSPLVHQGAVTAAMASLDSSLRFGDDGAVRFEIDGVAYDRPGDAVRAFFGQAWARPMLAPGASLPGFSHGSSHTPGDAAERTAAMLAMRGRSDAFSVGHTRAPRLDAPDPAERTAAMLASMGRGDAFRP